MSCHDYGDHRKGANHLIWMTCQSAAAIAVGGREDTDFSLTCTAAAAITTLSSSIMSKPKEIYALLCLLKKLISAANTISITQAGYSILSFGDYMSAQEASQAELLKMCNYQPWEDDSPSSEDHEPRTRNVTNTVATGWHPWETRIAILEARIARIEVRLDGLEARMFYQQKALRIISLLFLVTLAYAIWK
ncbi:hypothetical protein Godav_004239 [Gossypium davidsonii]|uniref:Uncharacterized protein n=1 Tax=Gossypium davidsonii TaxID=34287 RepID=A0A7J8SKE0_GOSDV|nr:hypothetical protein [Gossypium davidsonii]